MMSSINKKTTQNNFAMTTAKAMADMIFTIDAGNGKNWNRTNKKKTKVKTV